MFVFNNAYDKPSSGTITEEDHSALNKKLKVPKSNSKAKDFGLKILDLLQTLGKTLQFPISVLPFAAILNRFGALGVTYSSDTVNGALVITNQAGYWISFIVQTPGATIFSNLPLFFAIGTGFGIAKDHRGEAALAATAFFLVTVAMNGENGLAQMIWQHLPHNSKFGYWDNTGKWWCNLYYAKTYSGSVVSGGTYVLDTGVVGGIVAGCFTAFLYNRFKNIVLPQALSFFGGRRFVPMLAISCAVPMSFLYAIVWPWIQFGLTSFGSSISGSNASLGGQVGGVLAYGIINRLLLPFGLHQILNTFLWFQLPIIGPKIEPFKGVPTGVNEINGVYTVVNQTVNGDINAFTGGIFGSGNFQSGYFPIMMGGLPAAVVAMIFAAKKENRASVVGFLGGAAAISFLTGITEPIEYSFVFISPVLLILHALMTGMFNAIIIALHIKVGFGFSAGFIDYCVSFPYSWGFAHFQGCTWKVAGETTVHHGSTTWKILANPLWMLPFIAAAFALYFFVFLTVIKKMNIQTPGREEDFDISKHINVGADHVSTKEEKSNKKAHGGANAKLEQYKNMAQTIVDIIGKDNIEVVDNCATRLRLDVKDNSIDLQEKRIQSAGMFGIKRQGKKSIQIVVGVDVEHVSDALRAIVHK